MRSLVLLLLLSGCQYEWHKASAADSFAGRKIETPLAEEFCTALLEKPSRGCTVTFTDGDTTRCVVVVPPNDVDAVAHEGAHCMGYSHSVRSPRVGQHGVETKQIVQLVQRTLHLGGGHCSRYEDSGLSCAGKHNDAFIRNREFNVSKLFGLHR